MLEGFSLKTVGKANKENPVASANKNSQFYVNSHKLKNIKLTLQPTQGKMVFFFYTEIFLSLIPAIAKHLIMSQEK